MSKILVPAVACIIVIQFSQAPAEAQSAAPSIHTPIGRAASRIDLPNAPDAGRLRVRQATFRLWRVHLGESGWREVYALLQNARSWRPHVHKPALFFSTFEQMRELAANCPVGVDCSIARNPATAGFTLPPESGEAIAVVRLGWLSSFFEAMVADHELHHIRRSASQLRTVRELLVECMSHQEEDTVALRNACLDASWDRLHRGGAATESADDTAEQSALRGDIAFLRSFATVDELRRLTTELRATMTGPSPDFEPNAAARAVLIRRLNDIGRRYGFQVGNEDGDPMFASKLAWLLANHYQFRP